MNEYKTICKIWSGKTTNDIAILSIYANFLSEYYENLAFSSYTRSPRVTTQ